MLPGRTSYIKLLREKYEEKIIEHLVRSMHDFYANYLPEQTP
jgi:hypothetical protein